MRAASDRGYTVSLNYNYEHCLRHPYPCQNGVEGLGFLFL